MKTNDKDKADLVGGEAVGKEQALYEHKIDEEKRQLSRHKHPQGQIIHARKRRFEAFLPSVEAADFRSAHHRCARAWGCRWFLWDKPDENGRDDGPAGPDEERERDAGGFGDDVAGGGGGGDDAKGR